MPIENLPNRASDAGPDVEEKPPGWRDYLEYADDAIRDAKTVFRADPIERQRMRLAAIDRAIESLQAALLAVNRG